MKEWAVTVASVGFRPGEVGVGRRGERGIDTAGSLCWCQFFPFDGVLRAFVCVLCRKKSLVGNNEDISIGQRNRMV